MMQCLPALTQPYRPRILSLVLATMAIAFLGATMVRAEETSSDSPPDKASSTPDTDENRSSTEEPEAGHSYHGEVFNEGPRQAAYLMPGTGQVHFPVESVHPEIQPLINQGVGQLHGFWYFEAERTFRQAASIEPECAAAYWGMAMANTKNRERAQGFIKEAVEHRDQANDYTQRFINALDKLLNADKEKAKQASEDYIQALEQISYAYPEDLESKAFIALHLWEGRGEGVKIASHLAVDALIQQVLDVNPLHPIHHYRIHLWDYEKPERALASSALCGQSAPAIAHMWHMPGHIYSRLKRYDDAVWQQEASARTDHAQMMRDRLLPDQIHNFAHNNEWLIRNLIFVGRIHDAKDLALNMIELPRHPKYNEPGKNGCSAQYGRTRLVQVLSEAELWEDAIALSNSPYLEQNGIIADDIERAKLVGRAAIRTGNIELADQQRAWLQSQIDQKQLEVDKEVAAAREKAQQEGKNDEELKRIDEDLRRKATGDLRRLRKSIDELEGNAAFVSGDYQRAIEKLEQADKDDLPLLAQAYHLNGDTAKALEMLRDFVEKHPSETIPLAHLVTLQWQAGRETEARNAFETLREISADVDLDAPPFQKLSEIATALGYAVDWRRPQTVREDVGQRPPLDSLGPFRWQPSAAPDWTLPNAEDQPVSLSQYRGKHVLAIFYLGFGCLHCAEQLHAFGPRTDEFRRAGIEIVAISSDDQAGLKQSIEDYTGGPIPFPLVADPDLNVFRQYRVYDDFEQQPLHGTFLIDSEGKVRWQDISYEPFMGHEFILKEAQRLLAN